MIPILYEQALAISYDANDNVKSQLIPNYDDSKFLIKPVKLIYDDFIPIENSDMIDHLSIMINHSTDSENSVEKNVHLKLYDKKSQIIPHTTFFVKIMKDNEILIQDLFHTHSGTVLLKINPIDDTEKWTVIDGELTSSLGFVSTNDMFDIETPFLIKGSYKLHVSVFGIYDEKSMFLEKSVPKFESSFTVDTNGTIATKKIVLFNDERVGSPLKQFKFGIESKDILCKKDLEIALKSSNGQPICITPSTKEKLIERGWAKPV